MFYLLLGPNLYSKQEYIKTLANDLSVSIEFVSNIDDPRSNQELVSDDLFSKPKIFVLNGFLQKFNSPAMVEKLVASKNHIIFLEEKLDKRSTENKTLISNKSIITKDFVLPHGNDLDSWILEKIKKLGGSIDFDALEEFSVRMGRENFKETKVGGKVIIVEENYNLDQVDSEIQKLFFCSYGKVINITVVKELVEENYSEDIFGLTNAVADGNKMRTMYLVSKFLEDQTGSDEKAAIIKLNAILSEQFRNIAVVQSLIESKNNENDILDKTGWKSGRLYIMKKIASRFHNKKILETLKKLNSLDEELKTSNVPPKVLIDLILTQLFI